jgi:hypothetical protein
VLPGADTQLPNDGFKCKICGPSRCYRQSDDVAKFNCPAKRLEFVAGHLDYYDLPPTAQQLGRGKAIIGSFVHWPERLKGFRKRSQAFSHESPVLAVHLMAISDAGVREQNEDFIKALFDIVDTKENLNIHAACTITSSSGNAPDSTRPWYFDMQMLKTSWPL